jgi:hypothetical protein
MQSNFKYRLIALTLTIIFAVFNVGLLVVVASCPMMKYMDSNRCMMCDDGSLSRTVKFTRVVDKSCCETKYAADRNKTEFLQTSQRVFDSAKLIVAILLHIAPQTVISNPQSVITASASPPLVTDIPILTSSLLI